MPMWPDMPDFWQQIFPPGLISTAKTAGDILSALSSGVGFVSGAINAVTTVGQLLGILSPPDNPMLDALKQLDTDLKQIASQDAWHQVKKDGEQRLRDIIDDFQLVGSYLMQNKNLTGMHNDPFLWDTLRDAGQKVSDGEGSYASERRFDDSVTTGEWSSPSPSASCDPNWRPYQSNRPCTATLNEPDLDQGYVYDWRLGVAPLMQLESIYLNILAAMDPSFLQDGLFTAEINSRVGALQQHFKQMIDGVRCTSVFDYDALPRGGHSPWDSEQFFTLVCADIYTGVYTKKQLSLQPFTGLPQTAGIVAPGPLVPGLTPSPVSPEQFWSSFARTQNGIRYTELQFHANDPTVAMAYQEWNSDSLISWRARMINYVYSKMPLFQLESMINTLQLYAARSKDLTEVNQRIPWAGDHKYCLDVPPGASDGSITPCIYSAGQRLTYNRARGEIRNVVTNQCLTAVSPTEQETNGHVQLLDCDGTLAQQWSYDPVGLTIDNALGLTLVGNTRGGASPLAFGWLSNSSDPAPKDIWLASGKDAKLAGGLWLAEDGYADPALKLFYWPGWL
jgi:hypothetical protein